MYWTSVGSDKLSVVQHALNAAEYAALHPQNPYVSKDAQPPTKAEFDAYYAKVYLGPPCSQIAPGNPDGYSMCDARSSKGHPTGWVEVPGQPGAYRPR